MSGKQPANSKHVIEELAPRGGLEPPTNGLTVGTCRIQAERAGTKARIPAVLITPPTYRCRSLRIPRKQLGNIHRLLIARRIARPLDLRC
jgi:hypothetical protein